MEAPYHRQPTSLEEVPTLWIGGLKHSVDEKFFYDCFARTGNGEVKSVRLIRNRITGQPEGYGFIEFISHEAAENALQRYNGARVPGTELTFRLNWASFSCGKEAVVPSVGKINRKTVCDADWRHPHARPDHSNGGYCSTRPMRLSAAIPNTSCASQLQNGAAKAMYPAAAYTIPQARTVLLDTDLTNTTIFIGNLDPNVTEEELRQICVQFGELRHVMIPFGEGCGFVQYASMASAKEVVQCLHGIMIGQRVVRLSWGKSPTNKQFEGTTSMATAAGSHVPGMEQNKVYDPMNLPDIDKEAKVVTDQNTGRSEGYESVKLAVENEKTRELTETNGVYCSTRPVRISAAIPKMFSGSQLQDGAAKDTCRALDSVLMDESPFLVGSMPCPVKDLLSLPVTFGSVSAHPSLLVERKRKKKKKKKKKRKKRTGSASPRRNSLSPLSTVGSSAPPWGDCLPVWSVPWSGLPCGCPWPLSSMDALNIQPTQYGLHQHLLPDKPNELLTSFKPWMQRFYGYGGTIPCPHDLVPLEAFKQKCPLSEPYVLHNGKEIGVTAESGRFVVGGLVEDILNTFKKGYSWGGDFSKEDIAVQIGVRCYVSKVANLPGTYKNLCKDLDQAAEALIPHFRGVHKNNIPFIEHLYETMKNPLSLSSSAQERQRYLKFLKSHPARADPLSVSSLLVGIAQTYKSMGLSDKKAFEAAVKLIDLLKSPDWRDKVKSDLLWSQVYTEKQRKSIKKKKRERYACTAVSLSIFLRHFIIHSPEYTLDGGVQLMKTIDEVDYLVADFFDDFIAELFKILVYEFDMDKDILKSVWKMYDVGEDRKEIIKRIWKGETELDFMLETQEVTLTQSHAEASASGQAMAD